MIEPQIIDHKMIEVEENRIGYLKDFREKYGSGADNFIDGLINQSEEKLNRYRQMQQKFNDYNLKQEHGK